MKPKVSVVIPVFNSEVYLHNCIDSVLEQELRDFELLLIDDGSTDKSGILCDEYAAKDGRIRVIHKENGGVSSARNKGIEEAKGEWITFVDSDDKLTKDALLYMVSNAEENNADAYLCTNVSANTVTNSISILSQRQVDELIWACLAFHTADYVNKGFYVDAPYAKLFRKSIIKKNNLKYFEELSRSEDAIFDAYFYYYSDIIIMDTHSVYIYNVHTGSLCHSFNVELPNMLKKILQREKSMVDTLYPSNTYFQQALYVRSYKGFLQLLNENGFNTLELNAHKIILKKYLTFGLVNTLLKKFSFKQIGINGFSTYNAVTLFLIRRQSAYFTLIWLKNYPYIIRIRVHIDSFLRKLCFKKIDLYR